MLLHVDDAPAGIGLIPAPIKGLSRQPELYDQIAGEVLRLDLAALLPPQPDQGSLVLAHDGPGVGAAEITAAVLQGGCCQNGVFHDPHPHSNSIRPC